MVQPMVARRSFGRQQWRLESRFRSQQSSNGLCVPSSLQPLGWLRLLQMTNVNSYPSERGLPGPVSFIVTGVHAERLQPFASAQHRKWSAGCDEVVPLLARHVVEKHGMTVFVEALLALPRWVL